VKSGSHQGRARGPARRKSDYRRARNLRLSKSHLRSLRLELLETRALLTYTYPYGASPDDTGEYMLGDVAVNVVLMESDPTMAPYDNNPTNDPVHPGHGLPVENWNSDPSATGIDSIATIKQNVSTALQWWKDTLVKMFPDAPANLLDFHINWTYADNPIHTGYEPIARISNDFAADSLSQGGGKGWIYDFLHQVGFDATGNFTSDMRAFNDYSRQQANTDWATTIFVVNNAADSDKLFAPGGSFQQAFSFAGGRFEIVPASRPIKTFAHETGHQFWALDEYLGGGTYTSQRGYYNTQNLNAADNPAFAGTGTIQADSIMSNDPQMQNSFDHNTLDPYTMAQIGWQDSDHNGIFDVLDVPFSLSGFGRYNGNTGKYEFRGSSNVNALPNRNSSGTGDDIQIDQIGIAEYSLDDGANWQQGAQFGPRTYSTPVSLDIAPGAGIHDIWIRTRDLRTGVTSNIFQGEVNLPTQDDGVGAGGIVFLDQNGNGSLDDSEKLEPNRGLTVLDESDQPVDFEHFVEPDDYALGTVINHPPEEPEVTLSATGGNQGRGDVVARSTSLAPSAGKVFSGSDILSNPWYTWSDAQGKMLRVDFASPVSSVSLKAYGASSISTSYGRLDAYTSDNKLVTRFSTGALGAGSFSNMTVGRPQGDIAYVIAYGRNGTGVVLDSLHWGPAATATTNSEGVYSLDYLPDGTYHVYLDVPAGYHLSTPATPYATVMVSGGLAGSSVNFGIAPDSANPYPFHNTNPPEDVNNDGFIAPNDALMAINYINAHQGEGEISPSQDPSVIGYIDVLADGFCAPNDALAVINWINSHPVGGGEPPPAGGGSSGGGPGGSGEGEGILSVPTPANAADYYAQNPIHLDALYDAVPDLPDLDPSTSATDTPATSGATRSLAPLLTDLTASSAKLQLTSLSPSTLLAKSDSLSSPAVTSWTARKTASALLDDVSSKLEKTLDDIAADVSQADIAGDA
jgi:hypothetical protein